MMFYFLSSSCGVYLCLSDSNKQSISDQRNQINSHQYLQNWSRRYSSHNSNIKCVGFESIHYAINLNVILSSMIFSEFDCVSIDVLLV